MNAPLGFFFPCMKNILLLMIIPPFSMFSCRDEKGVWILRMDSLKGVFNPKAGNKVNLLLKVLRLRKESWLRNACGHKMMVKFFACAST